MSHTFKQAHDAAVYVPPNAGAEQRRQMELAYYIGGMAMLKLITQAAQEDQITFERMLGSKLSRDLRDLSAEMYAYFGSPDTPRG